MKRSDVAVNSKLGCSDWSAGSNWTGLGRQAVSMAAGCAMAVPLMAEAEASWLDRLDEGLSYQSAGGAVRAELGGLLDFEGYTVDGTPPGLVFSDREYLIAPRMSLFLDSRWGGKLYSLVQMRFDRGFDPNSKPRGDERLDEYFLRYTPWEDGRVLHPGGEVRHGLWQLGGPP